MVMMTTREAIDAAMDGIGLEGQAKAVQLVVAYHGMPYYALLNGLACMSDVAREEGRPPGWINDFVDATRNLWHCLHERGPANTAAYVAGYRSGQWHQEQEANQHARCSPEWDHWNDGWRLGVIHRNFRESRD